MSSEGVQTDPDKVQAIRSWPTPTDVKQVRSFLGLAGYYRRFIDGFAKLAKPLHELTAGDKKKTSSHMTTPGNCRDSKVTFASCWTTRCEEAFQSLKDKLCSAPVLAFADVTQPFVMHVDASRDGLGAVLCQESQAKLRPVAYASRGLTPSEKNYPAHKLEFLGLKWSITDKFKDYLYSARGTRVFTDSNPLTYVLSSAKLDATGHRWLAALTSYDFSIHYKPGRCNQDADALSRRPHDRTP